MPSVLLVEDDPDTRLALCEVLERAGYAVVSAADGRYALRILHVRSRFDLILLDWLMPAVTGAEVVACIDDEPSHRGTPIVVLSGHDRVPRCEGVCVVVAKPVRTRTLVDVVDRLVGMPPRLLPLATRPSPPTATARYLARTIALRPPRD